MAKLSHKATIAIILKEDAANELFNTVQSIREEHDRSFVRWPPHINLLYPFLESPSSQLDEIVPRLEHAIADANLQVISGSFPALHQFQHSPKRATVFLEPNDETRTQIQTLQAVIQAAFPECDGDTRPFVPHLTLGQAGGGTRGTATLKKKMEAKFSHDMHAWTINSIVVLERTADDPFRVIHTCSLLAP
ncbi:hypothetical protein THRCLA_03437 [Thraustotheca clavata]|uniref:2'-5' RNA ligase family protein n=1 Tax=Thraustotheca clavata TaxID=74557 RepID=A0A1W0A227_9STRA|nr:hypothetical protein THRCLA_03437 [Thraustotheca clavata]